MKFPFSTCKKQGGFKFNWDTGKVEECTRECEKPPTEDRISFSSFKQNNETVVAGPSFPISNRTTSSAPTLQLNKENEESHCKPSTSKEPDMQPQSWTPGKRGVFSFFSTPQLNSPQKISEKKPCVPLFGARMPSFQKKQTTERERIVIIDGGCQVSTTVDGKLKLSYKERVEENSTSELDGNSESSYTNSSSTTPDKCASVKRSPPCIPASIFSRCVTSSQLNPSAEDDFSVGSRSSDSICTPQCTRPVSEDDKSKTTEEPSEAESAKMATCTPDDNTEPSEMECADTLVPAASDNHVSSKMETAKMVVRTPEKKDEFSEMDSADTAKVDAVPKADADLNMRRSADTTRSDEGVSNIADIADPTSDDKRNASECESATQKDEFYVSAGDAEQRRATAPFNSSVEKSDDDTSAYESVSETNSFQTVSETASIRVSLPTSEMSRSASACMTPRNESTGTTSDVFKNRAVKRPLAVDMGSDCTQPKRLRLDTTGDSTVYDVTDGLMEEYYTADTSSNSVGATSSIARQRRGAPKRMVTRVYKRGGRNVWELSLTFD